MPAAGPRPYPCAAMSLPTTHQHMTAAEFAALPEGPPHFQLVEGELYFMASPSRQHQDVVLNFAFSIKAHLRAHPGVGRVYIAPSDVELNSSNVFEPDVYFVSHERQDILTRQGATGAPDLVVEVLSPSTARLDLEKKRGVYLRAGVREIWFVWPGDARMEIHLPGTDAEEAARTLRPGDVLTTPLLPGWSLPVAEVFE